MSKDVIIVGWSKRVNSGTYLSREDVDTTLYERRGRRNGGDY